MGISIVIMEQMIQLFLIMVMGGVIVKTGVLKGQDSHILSAVTLYLITPCVILEAFQVDYTPRVRNGLLLALGELVIIHILILLSLPALGRIFRLDAVEKASIAYSNSGNLIIPLVTAALGKEWVIYSSAFMSVQLFFMWSHGKMLLCGEKKIALRKIFSNINMIAVLAGAVLFISGCRLPSLVRGAMDSAGKMIGPMSMLIAGMLIGDMSLKKVFSYRRLGLVTFLRMIVFPALSLVILKYSPLAGLTEDGFTILLITLLAVVTPTASSITQMSQIYGKNAEYASVINAATSVVCMVTMPLMVFLYQL